MSNEYLINDGILRSKEFTLRHENEELGDIFLNTLRSKPDFVGQVDPYTGQETTYKEMLDNSVRCALWMRKQGIKSQDVVLSCTRNCASFYIPFLATLYNGAANALEFKVLKFESISKTLQVLKPKFIFIEEDEVEEFKKAVNEVNLDTKIIVLSKVIEYYYLNDILEESNTAEIDKFCCIYPQNKNHNCIIAMTSGSTDKNKMAIHTYDSIRQGFSTYVATQKKIDNPVSFVTFPIFWFVTLRTMLVDILSFTKRILVSETVYDLDEIFKLITKYKVTHIRFHLPIICRIYKWKQLNTYDTSLVRNVTFSGAKLPLEVINFFTTAFKNGCFEQHYGATEMSAPMCRGIMNEIDEKSCGYLFPNMMMKVQSVETGEILGQKEIGELCFKTPYVTKGYIDSEEANQALFDSEGWFRSGDLGYFDDSRLVYIVGRIKNSLILKNGKIVSLWDIDRALIINSDVMQSVVLPDPNFSESSKIFAFVKLCPNPKIVKKDLTELANIYNEDNKLSITVKILDQIPMTQNGKVNLNALQKIMITFLEEEKLSSEI